MSRVLSDLLIDIAIDVLLVGHDPTVPILRLAPEDFSIVHTIWQQSSIHFASVDMGLYTRVSLRLRLSALVLLLTTEAVLSCVATCEVDIDQLGAVTVGVNVC